MFTFNGYIVQTLKYITYNIAGYICFFVSLLVQFKCNMTSKNTSIPVHKLQERTDKGIMMSYVSGAAERGKIPTTMHRDDHYIFLFQESGVSKMILDFQEIELNGAGVFYILPAQAHQILEFKQTSGWFLAVDTSMIEVRYRTVFEEFISQQRPVKPATTDLGQIKQCAELLYLFFMRKEQSFVSETTLRALVSAYVGMIAEIYLLGEPQKGIRNLRPQVITRQFRKILRSNFKSLKRPSDYASELCLSLSYLNECVKEETGSPVSHWVHQEIVLEAKRLLCYSNANVKQIAFSLGYDDHAYFSRLFTRLSGMSPLQFRKLYRE